VRRGIAAAGRALTVALAWAAAGAWAADGRLEWARVAELGFAVGGVVAEVPVAAGQEVAKGALLARLDTRPFDARVREAEARVEGLEPAYAEARREHERAEALFERMVISAHERELRRIAMVRAEAALRAARAALERARVEREYAELRAPFAGRVVAVHVAPGQAVAAGLRIEPVVSLAETGRMALRVPLAGRPPVGAGEAVRVRVRGRALEARVERLWRAEDGRWWLRAVFAVPPGVALEPGAAGEVLLP